MALPPLAHLYLGLSLILGGGLRNCGELCKISFWETSLPLVPFPNMRFLAEFPFLWGPYFQQPDNQIERHSVSRISSFLPGWLQPVVIVHLIRGSRSSVPGLV